jgi:antitoxin MazE
MLVSKWGNSLGVRLPKALVDELGLREGDEIELVVAERGRLGVVKDETAEMRRQQAVKRMADRQWKLPAGYRFDRHEANER